MPEVYCSFPYSKHLNSRALYTGIPKELPDTLETGFAYRSFGMRSVKDRDLVF